MYTRRLVGSIDAADAFMHMRDENVDVCMYVRIRTKCTQQGIMHSMIDVNNPKRLCTLCYFFAYSTWGERRLHSIDFDFLVNDRRVYEQYTGSWASR